MVAVNPNGIIKGFNILKYKQQITWHPDRCLNGKSSGNFKAQ